MPSSSGLNFVGSDIGLIIHGSYKNGGHEIIGKEVNRS
jgi:hypothetical protein